MRQVSSDDVTGMNVNLQNYLISDMRKQSNQAASMMGADLVIITRIDR